MAMKKEEKETETCALGTVDFIYFDITNTTKHYIVVIKWHTVSGFLNPNNLFRGFRIEKLKLTLHSAQICFDGENVLL